MQPFARMGPVADMGMRIGMGSTLTGIGVIAGPPIAGALLDATGSFRNVGYYAGKRAASATMFAWTRRSRHVLCRVYVSAIGCAYRRRAAFCHQDGKVRLT